MTRSRLFPQISASASTSRSNSNTLDGNDASESYGYGLSGQQLIWDGLRTLFDWEQSDYKTQSAFADYQLAENDARSTAR
jgi:outer membrane protein TolC